MHKRSKTAALALTGAVALASGAYALGTQTGGGSAVAADQSRPEPPAFREEFRRGMFGPERLADRLGVEESELREALEDVRPQLPDPGEIRNDFAERLAQELGIDEQRVEAALERMRERVDREHEQRRDELAERLADRLNLDPDRVRRVLGEAPLLRHVHPAPPLGP